MVLPFCAYIIAHLPVQALASTVNEEELADLKDQFDAIDVDKSGSISIEEMRHVRL
jgi:Ca2+-binding EF-hand superfamily protein